VQSATHAQAFGEVPRIGPRRPKRPAIRAAWRTERSACQKERPERVLRPHHLKPDPLVSIRRLTVSHVLRTSSVNNAQSSMRLKIFLAFLAIRRRSVAHV